MCKPQLALGVEWHSGSPCSLYGGRVGEPKGKEKDKSTCRVEKGNAEFILENRAGSLECKQLLFFPNTEQKIQANSPGSF